MDNRTDSREFDSEEFYERFWADTDYQLDYALDSAVRDRFPAIQKVWGHLRTPTRVLDYGCGNGVLTYWMHANGFGQECLGLDISCTGVEYARRHFTQQSLAFQNFDPGAPLNHLGLFDVIVSSHVLEHIPVPHQAVAQILPLADWFVLEVPLERCIIQNAIASLLSNGQPSNPLGHVNFWSKREFRVFLESLGLMIIRDLQYASAPFSPYNSRVKRWVERTLLAALGIGLYGRLMVTHYTVLARRHPAWRERLARITLHDTSQRNLTRS